MQEAIQQSLGIKFNESKTVGLIITQSRNKEHFKSIIQERLKVNNQRIIS